MKNPSSTVAWILLAGALAAAIGVTAFALSLQGQIADSAKARAKGAQVRDQDLSAAQQHMLVQATAQERASLEGALHTDILSIAGLISAVGKDAGVNLQVSDALSETAPAGKGSISTIQAIGFTIKGDGSFAKLIDAATLLQALPIPASIEQLDIVRTSADANTHSAPSWHMDARIRVLTTAQISP